MKKIGLIFVICIALCVRILYMVRSPNYVMTGDSISYYLTAKIIMGTHTIVDPWRTPVYPLILAIPYIISGNAMPENVFGVFQPELYGVRVTQSLVGITTAVLLYVICMSVGIWIPIAVVLSIIATSDVMILLLEHTLLTESFALLLLSVMTMVMYSVLQRFSKIKFMLLVALWILCVFLRPSLIGIPIICCVVLLLRFRTPRMLAYVLIGLLLYGGSIAYYSHTNWIMHGYNGLSRISDVNIWGKLLSSGVTPDVFPKTEIGEMAKATYSIGSNDPWAIFRGYPQLFNRDNVAPYHDFVHSVLMHSIPKYLHHTVRMLPLVVVAPTVVINKTTLMGVFDSFFLSLQWIFNALIYLTYIPLLSFPIVIVWAVQRKSATLYLLVFLIAIGWYHVGIASALAYEDFGRHISIVRGLLFLSLGMLIAESTHRWYEKN